MAVQRNSHTQHQCWVMEMEPQAEVAHKTIYHPDGSVSQIAGTRITTQDAVAITDHQGDIQEVFMVSTEEVIQVTYSEDDDVS
jgi:hypothetical protein